MVAFKLDVHRDSRTTLGGSHPMKNGLRVLFFAGVDPMMVVTISFVGRCG